MNEDPGGGERIIRAQNTKIQIKRKSPMARCR